MKNLIIVILLLVIGGGVYWYVNNTNIIEQKDNTEIITTSALYGEFKEDGSFMMTDMNTGIEREIDFNNAPYFETYTDINKQRVTREGDFEEWLKIRKQIWSPNYDGPGAPGNLTIEGYLEEDILKATKILQEIQ
jgi:hypothetical protein